jgi:hypothetical protein
MTAEREPRRATRTHRPSVVDAASTFVRPLERFIPLARARARLSQRWSVYGRPVTPPRASRDALMHAARTRVSAGLIQAQLYALFRRPRGPLPSDIASTLAGAAPQPDAVTWVVHHRPRTRRRVVHEMGADGRLLSVVKIGARDDADLRWECAVLEALADASRSDCGLVVPTLVSIAESEHERVLRTRFDFAAIQPPPYSWDIDMLTLARRVLDGLHDRLATATATIMSRRPTPATLTDAAPTAVETIAHGDFTAWNVFLLDDGPERRLAVIDYEDVGTRPPWWDAARLLVTLWTERRVSTRELPAAAATLGTTRHKMLQYVDVELRSAPFAVEAVTIPLSATRARLAAMRW